MNIVPERFVLFLSEAGLGWPGWAGLAGLEKPYQHVSNGLPHPFVEFFVSEKKLTVAAYIWQIFVMNRSRR